MGNSNSHTVPEGCLPKGLCRTCGKCDIDYAFVNGFLCLNSCNICPEGTFSCGDEQTLCTSDPELCFGERPAFESLCPTGSMKAVIPGAELSSNGCGTEEFNFSGVVSPEDNECCNQHDNCYNTGTGKDACDDALFQCLSGIGSDALAASARVALQIPVATDAWKAAQEEYFFCEAFDENP